MRLHRADNSKINMCKYCLLDFATCPKSEVIEFGDGVGNDNVIACTEYQGINSPKVPVHMDTKAGVSKSNYDL